ncbi:condensin complex subunit 2-like isoform X2 [Photinus pyralis]|uniref:condensin complex subunit 2-like isoform X2 n=1 Tax=Photinus pyralis TaxID=7054 RepID=UPI00126761DD|nr:condensin complex subunit 2-like isoform X2 [Photinus pyralis]
MDIPSTSRQTSSRFSVLSHIATVRNDRRTSLDNLNRLSRILVQSPLPSDNEIKEHFQICLKLFAENRISAKNVWNLKLIDYMRMVLISKSQEESLQVASTSLDVGAKIYGIRVDDIHSDGFKLASNMARVNHQPEIEEHPSHDDSVNQENRASKRKRKHGQPATIAKNPETLLEDIPRAPSRFFQTKTDAEVILTSSLLTNILPMHPFGHKLMLFKAKAWPRYRASRSYPKQRYSFDIPYFDSFVISAPFAEFEIDQWDIDREDEQFNDISGAGIIEIENAPVYELDGTIRDNFEHGEEDQNQKEEEEKFDYILHFPVNSISRRANDCSFLSVVKLCNNKVMSRVWAGPSHWKLKYLQPKRSKFTGKQRAQSSKKERRTDEIINFLLDYPKIDKTKLYQSKTTVQNFDPIKCSLPLKIHLENKGRPFMLKPLYICNNYWVENNENVLNRDEECNNNITMPSFETGHQINEAEMSTHEEVNVCHQRQESNMDFMVDIPETVQHLYVPYASSYKKINMTTLKQAIWKIILGESNEEPNIAEVVQKQSFSEVYQQLPQRLSVKMQKNLSCPLALVALLHLGNERNLLFTQFGESDFNIEQQNQHSVGNIVSKD